MSECKHTPGPWWIWKERAGCDEDELLDFGEHAILAGDPKKIAPGLLSGGDFKEVCSVSDSDDANYDAETRLANARLIAAAPDLLAAIEGAMDAIETYHEKVGSKATGDMLRAARAAIAKAKGGE